MAATPVVSDKMHYGLKPIAKETEAHGLTLPCVGAADCMSDTYLTTIFCIQHNPSGRFVNPTATRFKFMF